MAASQPLQEPQAEVSWTSGSIDVGSFNIKFIKSIPPSSNLPVFVFLHGLTDCGPVFLPSLTALAGSYEIFLPDARGHGACDPIPDGTFTMTNLVQDAANAIKCFSPGQPVLLGGHSMGAATAARVAKLFPDLVRAVALEEPPWLRCEGEPVPPPSADNGRFNPLGSAEKIQAMSPEEFAVHDESSAAPLPPFACTKAQAQRKLQLQKLKPGFDAVDDIINEAVNGITVPALLQLGGPPRGHCKVEVAQATVATWPRGKSSQWDDAGHGLHHQKEKWEAEVHQFFQSVLSQQP